MNITVDNIIHVVELVYVMCHLGSSMGVHEYWQFWYYYIKISAKLKLSS